MRASLLLSFAYGYAVPMKRLVVTADDFGLSYGVVTGILEAHRRGIVTSTSLMVNAPAADSAFEAARATPELSVGLHFVLTLGRPVGPVEPLAPLLNAEHRFRRLEDGAHHRIDSERVRPELEAQIASFERALGRPPAHLDGHHHVHAIPPILETVVEVARERSLPVRAPDDPSREAAQRASLTTTGRFIDRFYGRELVTIEALSDCLRELPEGLSELMCHPAHPDPLLGRISSYSAERATELQTLVSEEIRELVNELAIELLPSSAL